MTSISVHRGRERRTQSPRADSEPDSESEADESLTGRTDIRPSGRTDILINDVNIGPSRPGERTQSPRADSEPDSEPEADESLTARRFYSDSKPPPIEAATDVAQRHRTTSSARPSWSRYTLSQWTVLESGPAGRTNVQPAAAGRAELRLRVGVRGTEFDAEVKEFEP